MGRWHRGRRLLVYDPRPPRRGDRLGSLRDGLDHAWREAARSGVGRTRNVVAPTSFAGQFEQPYGPMEPPTLFTIPVLRYMMSHSGSGSNLGFSKDGAAVSNASSPL